MEDDRSKQNGEKEEVTKSTEPAAQPEQTKEAGKTDNLFD